MNSWASHAELVKSREEMVARVLRAHGGEAGELMAMELAAGGNSRETWIAELQQGDTRRKLVFRCDPDHWIRPREMRREINGLRLAERAGVVAPRVLFSSEEVDIGRPFVVTEFVAGSAIARRVVRDVEFAEARHYFARHCGAILARLHGAAALADGWESIDPIADLEAHLVNSDYPSPTLNGALNWLERTRPAAPATLCPVHRDFRLGNLMMTPAGIAAVLDWETCHLSDPAEDLAWLCSRAWRYGSDLAVGGLGTVDDLLTSYREHGGASVEPERLHWWSVYAVTRWGMASNARQRAASAGDAMEQGGIARQVCRQEYNVLLELRGLVQ